LAQHDLAARLVRLPVPREAIPRLTRFVGEEVEQALEAARQDDHFTAAEIEAAGGAELLEALRAQRHEQRTVEAIRAAGLADLSPEALRAVLDSARS
jgi:hypothetical protein